MGEGRYIQAKLSGEPRCQLCQRFSLLCCFSLGLSECCCGIVQLYTLSAQLLAHGMKAHKPKPQRKLPEMQRPQPRQSLLLLHFQHPCHNTNQQCVAFNVSVTREAACVECSSSYKQRCLHAAN